MRQLIGAFVLFGCMAPAAVAQIPTHPNRTDSEGRRQGEWTLLFDSDGKVVSKPSQAYTYRIIEYSDGVPVGEVVDYYRSGRTLRVVPRMLSEKPERLQGKVISYLGDQRIQSIEWYNNGRLVFDKTEYSLRRLLDSVTASSTDRLYQGRLTDGLGEFYFKAGYYAKADSFFRAALKIKEGFRGNRYADIAASNGRLAMTEFRAGEYREADSVFQVVAKLQSTLRERDKVFWAVNLTQLAALYLAMGQPRRAEATIGSAQKAFAEAQAVKTLEYARSEVIMGRVCTVTGAYFRAEAALSNAVSIIEQQQGADNLDYADAIEATGALHNSMVMYREAEPFARNAVTLRERYLGKEHPDYAQALATLSKSNSGLNEYGTATDQLNEAIAIETRMLGEQHPVLITRLRELGILSRLMGNYKDADQQFNFSLTSAESVQGKNGFDYGVTLGELSRSLQNSGNYERAEITVKEALRIVESSIGKNNYHYTFFVGNLGQLYRTMGLYSMAAQHLHESKQIRSNVFGKQNTFYASSLINEGELYTDIGMLSTAERIFLDAHNILKTSAGTDELVYYALVTYNLGGIYTRMGRYKEAEAYYNTTLDIRTRKLGKDHLFYAHLLNSISRLYVRSGRYRKAYDNYLASLTIIDRNLGRDNTIYTSTQLNLADLTSLMGKKSQADSIFQKLVGADLKLAGPSSSAYAKDCYLYARHLWQENRMDTAAAYFKRSVKAYLDHIARNFSGMTDQEREMFYGEFSSGVLPDYYSFAIAYLGRDPSIAASIYDTQLTTKALLLNTSAKWKQLILKSTDKKLINSYFTWEGLLKRIALESKKESTNIERLDSLTYEADRLEKTLTKRADLFATAEDKRVVTWKDVQAGLGQGEVALEIIRFEKSGIERTVVDSSDAAMPTYHIVGRSDTVYYVFLFVRPGENLPKLLTIKQGAALEGRFLRQYRGAIMTQTDDQHSYAAYWQPLVDQLKGAQRVFISQDGVYNQINLATLHDPATGRYVHDETDLRMLTNTKDLVTSKASTQLNKYAILLGMPDYGNVGASLPGSQGSNQNRRRDAASELVDLPGTKVEVEEINELFTSRSWETSLLVGNAATEEAIKDSFKPAVLHMATHGFFDKDVTTDKEINPLKRTGLMLAGASVAKSTGEDGILTAYEAMNLNLESTDLVVLSACETGLGEVRNGEGVYGLQRSFIVAGARNLILSLWKVNDETTQKLMVSFYTNWLGGMDRHEAFRAAQNELRQSFANPYYWGAFIMIGR